MEVNELRGGDVQPREHASRLHPLSGPHPDWARRDVLGAPMSRRLLSVGAVLLLLGAGAACGHRDSAVRTASARLQDRKAQEQGALTDLEILSIATRSAAANGELSPSGIEWVETSFLKAA